MQRQLDLYGLKAGAGRPGGIISRKVTIRIRFASPHSNRKATARSKDQHGKDSHLRDHDTSRELSYVSSGQKASRGSDPQLDPLTIP